MSQMNSEPNGFLEMVERENGCIVSVGGLVRMLAKVDIEPPASPSEQPEELAPLTPAAAHTP